MESRSSTDMRGIGVLIEIECTQVMLYQSVSSEVTNSLFKT